MDYDLVARELEGIIEGEVIKSEEQLKRFSTDASIFEVKPSLIIKPKGARDIEKVTAYVASRKRAMPELSITARAAGTCMSGGPLSSSIIIDTTGLDAMGEIAHDRVTVEPGIPYRTFEAKTLEKKLILPSYTASKNYCALGGMIANNSSGERTLTHGDTSKYVERLSVVLADGNEYEFGPLTKPELEQKTSLDTFEGEVYRSVIDLIAQNYDVIRSKKPKVSKNSSGYLLWNLWNRDSFNLAQIFCGAQGTLGIITKAQLKLVPEKTHRALVVLELRTLAPLPSVVNTVLEFKPECFESFDEHTFSLAEKFLPEDAAKVVTDKATVLTLIAQFSADDEQGAIRQAKLCRDALMARGIEATLVTEPDEQTPYWSIRRSSFALLKNHSGEKERTAPFIDDFIVRPEDLPSFLPRLQAILAEYKMTYTIAGHIGNGNFHLIPLVDMEADHAADTIITLARRVFALVFEYGGSMAGEHNDGIIRTPFVKDMYGDDMYQIFEKVKKIFDPQNIFNPGKKVGGTIEYAKEHMAKTNLNPHL